MDASCTLKGEVALTEQDLYTAFSRLAPFRLRWWYLVAASLLCFTTLFGGRVALRELSAFLVLASLFLAFLFLWPLVMAHRTLAAMPDRTVRYEIEGEQLTITTVGSRLTRRWERVTRFREERTAFLIWLAPYAVHVIPKRAFSDEGVGRIRALLGKFVTPMWEEARRALRLRIVIFSAVLLLFLWIWEVWTMTRGLY